MTGLRFAEILLYRSWIGNCTGVTSKACTTTAHTDRGSCESASPVGGDVVLQEP